MIIVYPRVIPVRTISIYGDIRKLGMPLKWMVYNGTSPIKMDDLVAPSHKLVDNPIDCRYNYLKSYLLEL